MRACARRPSVCGEETTVRFGHPGIDLDNREY